MSDSEERGQKRQREEESGSPEPGPMPDAESDDEIGELVKAITKDVGGDVGEQVVPSSAITSTPPPHRCSCLQAYKGRAHTPGPMPSAPDSSNGRKKKRVAVLPHEKLFLEHLPESDRYYRSFMHRDNVNYVTVTK